MALAKISCVGEPNDLCISLGWHHSFYLSAFEMAFHNWLTSSYSIYHKVVGGEEQKAHFWAIRKVVGWYMFGVLQVTTKCVPLGIFHVCVGV